MTRRTVLLWDVDGTLLRTGPVGGGIFDVAIRRMFGRALDPDAFAAVRMGGRTDPDIAREVMLLAEIVDEDVDRHLPAMLGHLEAALADDVERIRAEGRVMPGVVDALSRLAADGSFVQTVVTGNLAANAAVKVGAFGLERWLDLGVGATGTDAADRRLLVPLALARVRERYGFAPDPARTWVIGDTPRDHDCAVAGGVRCLLVATGRPTYDELAACGADAVLADLGDTDGVIALLSS